MPNGQLCAGAAGQPIYFEVPVLGHCGHFSYQGLCLLWQPLQTL